MIDTAKYKKLLTAERDRLVEQLGGVGMNEPGDPTGWQPKAGPNDSENADQNDVADRLEDFTERNALEVTLELRLRNVNTALSKIENGSFGNCDFGGESHAIEPERLDANPAALTCLTHLDEEII